MSNQQENHSPRFPFRLQTLMVAFAFVAMLMVAGRKLYIGYTSTPFNEAVTPLAEAETPLAEAVAAFNSRASIDPIGVHEPPVTEDEIVTAIRSQLSILDVPDQVTDIYLQIANTRRLPLGANLNWISWYGPEEEPNPVWWVDLNIVLGPKSGYVLRIRKNDNPAEADGS